MFTQHKSAGDVWNVGNHNEERCFPTGGWPWAPHCPGQVGVKSSSLPVAELMRHLNVLAQRHSWGRDLWALCAGRCPATRSVQLRYRDTAEKHGGLYVPAQHQARAKKPSPHLAPDHDSPGHKGLGRVLLYSCKTNMPEPCACLSNKCPQRPRCKRCAARSFRLQNSALHPGWCQRLTRRRFFQKVPWKSCTFVSRTAQDRSSFGSGDQD